MTARGRSPRIRLDRRLKAVARLVRPNKSVADVGTDHGYVPCFLYQQGTREIYACDILEKPLAAAKATMDLYGIPEKTKDNAEGITLLLCDGLDGVPPVDDVIIAGMGGEMIADIISRCKFLNRNVHFILQPMTRDWILRKALYRTGLYIERETTASVGGKVYTVMLCLYGGEKTEIDEEFAFLGKNTDPEYQSKVLTALEKMGRGDKRFKELKEKIEKERQL
ncbi:MAG: class I SAM-dependent methyltransferase [Firmicutes bacterium]|nr:class I SAM-dependent methyltransferase [[Eubacterium] siraeum]MCM1488600.1 class I SAM-dependent methyltransferase [Bacillota bacterium]